MRIYVTERSDNCQFLNGFLVSVDPNHSTTVRECLVFKWFGSKDVKMPFEIWTCNVSGIQMNLVLGCLVFGWLL